MLMNSNDYIQEDIRIINLYSQSATTYLNGTLKSSVTFNFKNILRDEPDIIYSTIGISSAQIPVSYYTINEYNNLLVTNFGVVTITAGNYSASTLSTELYNKMSPLAFGSGLTITVSPTTGRIRFEDAVSFRFWRENLGVTSTAWDILGFDTSVPYYDSSIPLGGSVQRLTAPYLLNLLGIQQLRISSSALACNNSTSTQMGESNLIGVVQSTAPPYGMILYANATSYSVLRAKSISLIDIQILDENSNFVDFNNIDWTISLQLTIFRKIPLPSVTADFLKPILDTLGVIQGELSSPLTPPDGGTQDQPPDGGQGGADAPSFLNNDDNSLDIMSYNKQLPS